MIDPYESGRFSQRVVNGSFGEAGRTSGGIRHSKSTEIRPRAGYVGRHGRRHQHTPHPAWTASLERARAQVAGGKTLDFDEVMAAFPREDEAEEAAHAPRWRPRRTAATT
jgi:hypothetical protein